MASPLTPQVALANLQATALTARCHNPFFRQKQLKSLHNTLRNNISTIKDAIRSDTRNSEVEATAEVALALDIVKEQYNSINTKKDLEEEYRIAKGKNAENGTKPWDVVYIEPQQSHTPFFSAITALSAAIAAGSCVGIKVENNLRALSSLLRKLLPDALEADTFAIIGSNPPAESIETCLQVLQETQVEEPTYAQLASPRSKVIAVIDRTADLPKAAEQLVAARFAFGGTSPYAPDLVLVNEFVKKEFLEQVMQQSIRFLSGSSDVTANGKLSSQKAGSSPIATACKNLQDSKSWRVNVITQGDNGAIVELNNLSVLPAKISQPVFAISTITSLEHAISLVDEDLEPSETLLAGYHFAAPTAGKYLSQFINADASFTNHFPFRLLLGPAAPAFHAVDIEKRYTAEHFARVAPAYINAPASQKLLSSIIASKDAKKSAADLLTQASQEIREDKRAESIAIGYFEQGIFIGLGVYGIPILTCIGASIFFGVRAGLRRWVFA